MKRIIVSVCTAVLISGNAGINAYAVEEPEVSAKAAVLISADTGETIYSVNCNEKLPMASTTKIMTTMLCLESGNLYEEFEVDGDAIMVEGSSMGLQKGDIVTKYALCCGMLLPSGNDAANATAVKLAGSLENFAVMMNDRAKELGLSKTWFVTPSGLEGEGHGSSAYDMAILAREALKNDIFREICSSPSTERIILCSSIPEIRPIIILGRKIKSPTARTMPSNIPIYNTMSNIPEFSSAFSSSVSCFSADFIMYL